MLESIGLAGLLFLVLIALPLAMWLGAVVTRRSRLIGAFVWRYFRPLGIGLLVLSTVTREYARSSGSGLADVVSVVSFFLLAMMFVPMLRRLQGRTERGV